MQRYDAVKLIFESRYAMIKLAFLIGMLHFNKARIYAT